MAVRTIFQICPSLWSDALKHEVPEENVVGQMQIFKNPICYRLLSFYSGFESLFTCSSIC